MKFRKTCGASIAATVAISVLAGCSSTTGQVTGPLEKTNLVVDAFPAIDSVGLFIAEQEGLFKKQGLNVKIDLAMDSQSAITGQLAGTYDITSADYVTYIDNVLNDNAPLRIVAPHLQFGFAGGHRGLRLFDGDLVVRRVDLHQQVAFLHELVVVYRQRDHLARDVRRNVDDVGAHPPVAGPGLIHVVNP